MKKTKFLCTKTLLLLLSLAISAQAQIEKGSWGGGLNLGAQKGFGPQTYPMGIGFEALLSYKLSSSLTLTGVTGYRPIREKLGGNTISSTKLAFSDLLVEYDFAKLSNMNPFIAVGGGIYSIGFISTNNDRLMLAGEGAVGMGIRSFIGSQMAFKVTVLDKFTAEGVRDNKQKSYLTSTLGLTYYFNNKTALDDENLFTGGDIEDLPMETELNATPSQLVEYSRNLDNNSDFQALLNSENPPQEIQEYKKLQDRVNKLIEMISQKDMEITDLKHSILGDDAGGSSSYDSDANAQVAFTYAYEDGLYKFYSRRYDDAIDVFSSLVQNYPNHYLTSNCNYWLGEAYFSIGDFSQAIMSLDRVLDTPDAIKRDDALYMMGRAYKELGQMDKAREAFGRVINEYPKSEFVSKSLEILSNLR
ncbi:MAG: tetratricopeptide repeat protein [Deferribacteres bacterium]|nr:tetratricopeptide repeat protein [candidate division KSB1 bacterium]MCB9501754.1 tetratricopeptide repeat protein [Deferribacteres bacterium]